MDKKEPFDLNDLTEDEWQVWRAAFGAACCEGMMELMALPDGQPEYPAEEFTAECAVRAYRAIRSREKSKRQLDPRTSEKEESELKDVADGQTSTSAPR